MLNFLRKLRRNEMKGKYIKYAIGEVFLVVVGILIALSISDWSQAKKDRKFELFTLREIENNLKEDQTQIIEILNARRKVAISINDLSIIPFSNYEPEKLANDIKMIWGFERFFAIRNGYESLKSRGFLLSDQNLRTALGRYYENELTRISASILDLETTFLTQFNSIIQKGYFQKVNNQDVKVHSINDPDFENDLKAYVRGLMPNHVGTMTNLEAFKMTNESILSQINQAIKTLVK